MKLNISRTFLYFLCMLVVFSFETGCKAKSCPAYGDDTPDRGALFKKKRKKAKQGLFSDKQRRR